MKEVLSEVNLAILRSLKPWRDTKTDQSLPTLKIKEVSRATKIAPEKIIKALIQFPLSFTVNGSNFSSLIEKPEFSSNRLTLNDCARYGLSPIRIARAARYLSRSPGGGPVQKAAIQDRSVDNLIRKRAWAEKKITFAQIQTERGKK